jgi:hypothetical protein
LRYGITIWGNASNCYKEALQATQNKIIKMLYMVHDIKLSDEDSSTLAKGTNDCNEDIKVMYANLGILNINDLYQYVIVLNNYFNKNIKVHNNYSHSMKKRNTTHYHVPIYYNNYGKNVMNVKILITINRLSNSLKQIKSFRELKMKLKNYFLNR